MSWSAQQNPGGYSQPAIRQIQNDPLAMTTTAQEARSVLTRRARARLNNTPNELPIAANARKVDGFAPVATSVVT